MGEFFSEKDLDQIVKAEDDLPVEFHSASSGEFEDSNLDLSQSQENQSILEEPPFEGFDLDATRGEKSIGSDRFENNNLDQIPAGCRLGVLISEERSFLDFGLSQVRKGKNMTGDDSKPFVSSFVFKDVEESLDKFDGESGKKFSVWVKEFNDISEVCGWNDVQKYLYCRRLLTGAARLAIEAATGITSWDSLKQKLSKEFDSTPTALDIHKSLESRKKTSQETFLEYAYSMKILANRGNVDEVSLVAYIIAGIPDEPLNKTVLYEAKSLDELKEKYKVYEIIKAQQSAKRSTKHEGRPTGTTRNRPSSKKRCFNCGSTSHLTGACPSKSKGARCFSCGDFGHMAPNCPNKSGSNQSPARVNLVVVPDMEVQVQIAEKHYRALVDTGSDITLVRKSVYEAMGPDSVQCRGPSISLAGFGAGLRSTLGSFFSQLIVGGDNYPVILHVVPNHWLPNDVLIGKDVLKQAKVSICQGKATLEKIKDDSCENFLSRIDTVRLIEEDRPKCLEGIVDSKHSEEIRELVELYKPVKPNRSCIQMEIFLEDKTPVYQKPRRLAPKEKEIVDEQIKQWLQEGIIQESNSDFASPIVLARKKDGTYRLCVDYRRLNAKILKDRFPLPNIEDVLQSLYKFNIFSTLDLRNGFFHVDLHENSRKYSAFTTPSGQYEFLKVPFGLCNSPAVFSRYINHVFRDLIQKEMILIYMDDVIIPAVDEKESIDKLKTVLRIAAENGLIIKWEKCKFLSRSVEFLGHVIELGSIRPSVGKTKAVSGFPVPTSIKHVQAFLGLTNFFRKFIPNYSRIAKPLSDLTRKEVPFVFGSSQRDAFQMLKDALCNEPVLKLFNPTLETQLHTDASSEGYGGVLLQKHLDENQFHPVLYVSFKTTKAERNYSSYELEVLAVVKALKKLRVYLLGLSFTIYTDCKAFQLTMRKRELCSRVARWALFLEEFNCSVHHRSGTSMRHVDALSRYPSVLSIETGILQRVRNAQQSDEYCQLVSTVLKEKPYKDVIMRGGLLYQLQEGRYLLLVPKQLQRDILRSIHEQGHINSKKVSAIASQEYYIPNLNKKAHEVVANCIACILCARKQGKQEGFLNPIDKFDTPLHTFHLDHLGPLPSTSKNYRYLFVIVDGFTKFTWIYPVKSTSAEEVLKKLELQSEVFGNPRRIVTDRGTAFTASSFGNYCDERNIDHVTTTTGVPRGNGQVERTNQIIISVLSKLSINDPQKWFKFVPRIQRIINSTKSRSTKRTPFELMIGVPMYNQEDLQLYKVLEEEIVADFDADRQEMRNEARADIQKVQEENRKSYNRKRKAALQYNVHDIVAIKRTQFGPGLKLYPKYLGPYEVTKVKGKDRYEVQKVGSHEGPNATSSSADFMKPWVCVEDSDFESEDEDPTSPRSDDQQDGRMWETGISSSPVDPLT